MMTSIVDTFQSAVVSENPVNNGRVAGFTIDGGVFTQVGGDYNNYNIQGNLHQHNAELGKKFEQVYGGSNTQTEQYIYRPVCPWTIHFT